MDFRFSIFDFKLTHPRAVPFSGLSAGELFFAYPLMDREASQPIAFGDLSIVSYQKVEVSTSG